MSYDLRINVIVKSVCMFVKMLNKRFACLGRREGQGIGVNVCVDGHMHDDKTNK